MLTGRELIIYILENGLEDKPVFTDGKIVGLITIDEAAAMLHVGTATIFTWLHQGKIEHVQIGGELYIPYNFNLKDHLIATKGVESNA